MSDTGIIQFTKVIEFIKKKKNSRAVVEYQTYSKMPKKKSSDYIAALQERVLKGEVDIGNIPDSELELFNEKPSEEDVLKRKGEIKRNILIAGAVGVALFVIYLSGGFETTLNCENCGVVMQPNQTAYSSSAITSTAGALSNAGYHDKLCSTSCLAAWANKYPSIRNSW